MLPCSTLPTVVLLVCSFRSAVLKPKGKLAEQQFISVILTCCFCFLGFFLEILLSWWASNSRNSCHVKYKNLSSEFCIRVGKTLKKIWNFFSVYVFLSECNSCDYSTIIFLKILSFFILLCSNFIERNQDWLLHVQRYLRIWTRIDTKMFYLVSLKYRFCLFCFLKLLYWIC